MDTSIPIYGSYANIPGSLILTENGQLALWRLHFMARTLSWRPHIHAICDHVRKSQIETWVRKDIERVFGIKRVSAQSLMKAVGQLNDVAGRHIVSRDSLLSYLESLLDSENMELAHRERQQLAESAPHRRLFKNTLPKDLESVMLRDLPLDIVIESGRLEITGATADIVLQNLILLAKALENDLDSFRQVLDPPVALTAVADGDYLALMQDLRMFETEKDSRLIS